MEVDKRSQMCFILISHYKDLFSRNSNLVLVLGGLATKLPVILHLLSHFES